MSSKAEVIKCLEKSVEMIISDKKFNQIVKGNALFNLKTSIEQINSEHTNYHRAVEIARQACDEIKKMGRK